MGETRVDLQHLLEDLRDAYTGSLEETIISEVVANSLDSGADTIDFHVDPSRSTFTVVDDGSGMRRRELSRYHDLASTTKTRGEGIGFAGVGIKLGLLVSEETITETRRGKVHVATRWHLSSRHRAPWKWISPPGALHDHGTAVSLQLRNALSPLTDPSFIEASLRRHYQPLFDPFFAPFLADRYGLGVRFHVNGRALEPESSNELETAPIQVRLGRKRNPSAVGYLTRDTSLLPEERRGMAISTLGKVIRRGWDWLGISPAQTGQISGLIEAPALAASLTLNKADFIRTGPRGATYLAFRRAIQEAVAAQLDFWGDMRGGESAARRRLARPVERDLERVLIDLSDEFPLIAALVERRAGGQGRLPIGNGTLGGGRTFLAASVTGEARPGPVRLESGISVMEAIEEPKPEGPEEGRATPESGQLEDQAPAEDSAESASLLGTAKRRRPQSYGLRVDFESRPEDPGFARLVETTVWVNDAHPAYERAVASRSEGYHVALSVAMALAPLATAPDREREFIVDFMSSWGRALKQGNGLRRSRR
jgi:hypothetical protein